MRVSLKTTVIILCVCLVPTIARADMGLPLVAVILPPLWLALATLELVCCGEAKRVATVSAKLYAVTVQAPWLVPYEDQFWWMIPAALIVFAVPCYLISVLIEAPVNRAFLGVEPRRPMLRATAMANVASYVALGLLIWPTSKLPDHIQGGFRPLVEWLVEATFRFVHAVTGH